MPALDKDIPSTVAIVSPAIPQAPIKSREMTIPELFRFAAFLGVKVELPFRAPTNPEGCFTGLPGELRSHIYALLLVNLALGDVASVNQLDHHGLCPTILGVNKQIKAESSSYLYGNNVFCAVCLPWTGPS